MDESHLEEIPCISKGISEIKPENLQLEFYNSVYIKEEVPEQVNNYSLIKLIKNEDDESGDIFKEDKVSNVSIVKLEPEISGLEFQANNNMHNSYSDIQDSDKSNDEFAEQMKTDVKNENIIIPNESDEIVIEKHEIKNEEEDIKTEEIHQFQNSMLFNCVDNEKYAEDLYKTENQSDDEITQRWNIKKQPTDQVKPAHVLKCDPNDYQTLYKHYLRKHYIRHKNYKKDILFKCTQCDYQSRQKGNLKRHMLRHEILKDSPILKCEHCDYQTLHKNYLKSHVRIHKNPEDVNMFKCDHCNYQTRRKRDLSRHMLRHIRQKNPEDFHMFKCNNCDFKTHYKSNLKQHELRHKNPEDVIMFNCNYCNYKTCYKFNLKQHKLRCKYS